jgi:copper chaperone NosL
MGRAAMTIVFSRMLRYCGVFIVALASSFLACQSQPAGDAKPVEIAEGDTCTRCKQPIRDKRFAAEFATKDGFVRKFDDIGCMVEHAKKVKPGSIENFFTVDYDKKDWGKADEMTFLRSKNLPTPASGGLAAFRDKARAQSLATQFQGDAVAFSDLMK